MKTNTTYTILSVMAAALLACSCNKESTVPDPAAEPQEIVIGVADESGFFVETKATALSAIPSTMNWLMTTGTRNNAAEAKKYSATGASVASGKISTGKYQTATATAYNYYVSNGTLAQASDKGPVTVAASNTTDIIAGCVAASTSTSPSITLNHIFARTGTITTNAPSGYSVSNVSYKIVQSSATAIVGTAGTYSLGTGAWTAASTRLSSQTAITGSSDMYLIPGTYTLYVTYTISVGDWSETFTKSGNITLVGGKVNNITVTVPSGGQSPITMGLTLTAWGTNAVSVTVS